MQSTLICRMSLFLIAFLGELSMFGLTLGLCSIDLQIFWVYSAFFLALYRVLHMANNIFCFEYQTAVRNV